MSNNTKKVIFVQRKNRCFLGFSNIVGRRLLVDVLLVVARCGCWMVVVEVMYC